MVLLLHWPPYWTTSHLDELPSSTGTNRNPQLLTQRKHEAKEKTNQVVRDYRKVVSKLQAVF